MPWREIKVLDERQQFIAEYLKEIVSFTDLCHQYGISRKTGYKWVNRFKSLGLAGLLDLSKEPRKQDRRITQDIIDLIIMIKSERPKWGPKKIHPYLIKHYELVKYPCETSVENILKRNGLVKPRKLRRRLAKRTNPLTTCFQPNDIWCTDFKGWSLTSDHKRCGPYTLMDSNSRFLLSCVQLKADNLDHVWAVLEKNFYQYGLPLKLKSDNGPPFATSAPGRLSGLSIKLIKAGVIPEWTEPGHPEQNGRQERMHLTLQSEIISDNLTLSEQVQKFEEFIEYYNFVRPHEALNQKCPGEIYVNSEREWHGKLRSPEYSKEFRVGKVKSCGKMSFGGKEIYISRVFEGEPLGIKEEAKGLVVYYGPLELGVIRDNSIEFERRQARKR